MVGALCDVVGNSQPFTILSRERYSSALMLSMQVPSYRSDGGRADLLAFFSSCTLCSNVEGGDSPGVSSQGNI